MSKRVYEFALPYVVSGMYVHFGVDKLNSDGVFRLLPPKFQKELWEAASTWSELTITEGMLNELSDETLTALAAELDLKWHNK